MSPRLTMLDGVRWCADPIPGERVHALLAALVLEPSGVPDSSLVDQVWDDRAPANPSKALQVLVSRARAATDPGAITRYDGGYRLSVEPTEVDALLLGQVITKAQRALAEDPVATLDLLESVAALTVREGDTVAVPLRRLRAESARQLRALRRLRGLAFAYAGRPDEALPLLEAAHEERVDDAEAFAALLRSVSTTAGAAAALGRYADHRKDLADRLGVDPDPALQRLHRELLAADDPVRTGVQYDAEDLLGRAEDLQRLRTAVHAGRLTSILGPGGIGKTRVAHVLAREASQPRVHFVELVGVASPDDVIPEVGSALGVRDSMTGHSALSPARLADIRGRIAQQLDSGPSLLVLDNCEHVLEAVASLVAFLLVTTRDLHVLTTSRAPLRIAAERVVPLTQLGTADAADLFRQRALAVRPDVELDPETVTALVDRLDGLPLAVELAAARVRTMSVEEVRRRLDDRFELLRTRDRAAPERHRTLSAVISWSWDLLDTDEQRALAWLSLFHDGFDTAAATAVLGEDAADLVETLVEQSLLVVTESDGVSRFRALETIREFAALRLAEAGQRDDALRAQDDWAAELADRHASVFVADEQIASVDVLRAEENNLTDVLRRALARNDAAQVARLVRTLGSFWTITGGHPRLFVVADAAESVLIGWDPPESLRVAAQEAAGILLMHLSWLPDRPLESLSDALRRWGIPRTAWAHTAHAMFVQSEDGEAADRLRAVSEQTDDPLTTVLALMWAALSAEGAGEIDAAADYARRGLAVGVLTPWLEASLHGELAQIAVTLGDHRAAAFHAEVAWPILLRLHAVEDAYSMRIVTALAPLLDGDLDECERILDEVGSQPDDGELASRMAMRAARAELALARGDVESGFRLFDEAVAVVSDAEAPGVGLVPWLLMAAGGALVARVQHATSDDDARALELRDLILARANVSSGEWPYAADLPLNGVPLVALAAWALRFGDPAGHEPAVRLLMVALRWSYNRSFPTMARADLAALAERRLPGLLGALLEQHAERRPVDLVPVARDAIQRLTSSW